MRQIAEADAIENILTRRQVFQKHLRSEVALGQRRDRRQRPPIAKTISVVATSTIICDGRSARAHNHASVSAEIAGLHAMGNLRAVGGAAEVGHRNGTESAGAGRSCGRKKSPCAKVRCEFCAGFEWSCKPP